MKAGLIKLIGFAMIQCQMGVLVVDCQGMNNDLRRNAQREQG